LDALGLLVLEIEANCPVFYEPGMAQGCVYKEVVVIQAGVPAVQIPQGPGFAYVSIHLFIHLSSSSVPKTRASPSPAPRVVGGVLELTEAFSPSGIPYSENWTAEWSYLYPLATNIPNSGSFTFTPKPALPNYQKWKVGALRIIDSKNYAGQK
jgi:hypothetical protein